MDLDQHIWRAWAEELQRRGWNGAVAAILETVGPFQLLAAQIVYISQPFVQSFVPNQHLEAFTHIMEDPQQTREFINLLKKPEHK